MPALTEIIDSIIKPPRLEPGDIIGITAPSSQIDVTRVSKGMHYLKELGYRIILGNTIKTMHDTDFNSAPDNLRADELMEMFVNKDIKAIITARGGYGAQSILAKLDYEAIAKNPKIFMGFSDTTALNIAITQRSNIVTFNGPSVEITNNVDIDKMCLKDVLDKLSNLEPWGIVENYDKVLIRRISNPEVSEGIGRIIGGNLTMCATSLGTNFEIDTKNKILILEEIGETAYEIERTLVHLKNAGKLDTCKGIVFGDFVRIQAENSNLKPDTAEPSVNEILIKKFAKASYPVTGFYNFSHATYNLTIPIGVKSRMDSKTRTFEILEGCVQ